ncbi:unnamed protein product [Ostreobium quekettii]|uniref:RRM domain-containing protein n=1 Tax=Ostreobium quekettii TaxID=121088 RepID=A0A8S1JHE6_9CHLO|nr:unnamed protein product [Ostreobium quekettii]|eukprot:evm.model.scf_470.6 EVM.evm.TU.scf_470.6   scf_470:68385-71884(-)
MVDKSGAQKNADCCGHNTATVGVGAAPLDPSSAGGQAARIPCKGTKKGMDALKEGATDSGAPTGWPSNGREDAAADRPCSSPFFCFGCPNGDNRISFVEQDWVDLEKKITKAGDSGLLGGMTVVIRELRELFKNRKLMVTDSRAGNVYEVVLPIVTDGTRLANALERMRKMKTRNQTEAQAVLEEVCTEWRAICNVQDEAVRAEKDRDIQQLTTELQNVLNQADNLRAAKETEAQQLRSQIVQVQKQMKELKVAKDGEAQHLRSQLQNALNQADNLRAAKETEAQQLRSQIIQVQKQMEELKVAKEGEIQQLRNQARQAEKQMDELRAQKVQTDGDNVEKGEEIKRLSGDVAVLRSENDRLRRDLAVPPPQQTPPMPHSNLYVGHLPDWLESKELSELFARFGTITAHCVMPADKSHEHKYGLVEFATVEEAATAIREMHGYAIGDQQLEVKLANKPRKEAPRKSPTGGPRKLYVNGFPPDWKTRDLEQLFRGVGTITDIRVLQSSESNKGPFAFVMMSGADEAARAIEMWNRRTPHGCVGPIVVEYSRN